MKQARYFLAILLAALAFPVGLAQDSQHHGQKQPHYKLIDIGTFGGPQNYLPEALGTFQTRILDNHGVLIGGADTSQPDPFPNFCFLDCFVVHAFRTDKSGQLTDLGALSGGGSSLAQWMSRSGFVAGVSENGQTDPLLPGAPEVRAVLWHDGGITDLGTLEGGYESAANAVNSEGQVAGVFSNTIPDPNSMFGSGYQTRAFVWQDGVMQDLGTLGGTDAQALLINDRGQVVGWSYTSASPGVGCGYLGLTLTTDPFIWEEGKGMTDLGNFGGTCTTAFDLNNRGQVVGTSNVAGDVIYRAFLWSKGTLYDLGGSLGGTSSAAAAINERGEAVGTATLAGDILFHGAFWRRIGKLTDLGVLGGDQCSFGESINSKSQVVGGSLPDCGTSNALRPFVWDNGSIFDLNALIPPNAPLVLQLAQTINDRGEIAGTGVDANDNEHAFLLIPCDENHPDVEGCDYSVVEASGQAPARSAPHELSRPIPPATVWRQRNRPHFPLARPRMALSQEQ
jgi:probable HAF family extracellular repeat protein